jgi:3',5'-cyclic AMP phosphodiesterase CpdA
MHINNVNSFEAVENRLASIKDVDFILLGGDNVDVDNKNKETFPVAEQLYVKLKKSLEVNSKPYYATIGNHDRLPNNKDFTSARDSLFVVNFGKTYYSFDHKGVKFIVLNSVETKEGKYNISAQQIEWLEQLLKQTDKKQPIVISTHVPFLSVYYPVLQGKYTDADTFDNQHQVFQLFENHNLKLVLQGHMHLYEEIKVKGVNFITAGAVSGNWWSGDYYGTKPGHLEVNYNKGNFTWNYIK